jgi:hypothetical protein
VTQALGPSRSGQLAYRSSAAVTFIAFTALTSFTAFTERNMARSKAMQ